MIEARFARAPSPDDFELEYDFNSLFFTRGNLWISSSAVTSFDGSRWHVSGGRNVIRNSGQPSVSGIWQLAGNYDRSTQPGSQLLTPTLNVRYWVGGTVVHSESFSGYEFPGGTITAFTGGSTAPLCTRIEIGFNTTGAQRNWFSNGTDGRLTFLADT